MDSLNEFNCFIFSDEFSLSVMIWWIMSFAGVGPLAFNEVQSHLRGVHLAKRHR